MKTHLKNWAIIIPARLESTRLKRKPLQDLAGKPLIIRVYENLSSLKEYGLDIIVATDSKEILDVCHHYSLTAILTKNSHESGTQRCYEASTLIDKDFIINVQGDEPFINKNDILSIIEKEHILKESKIITLAHHSKNVKDYFDPNSVKLVFKKNMEALYFSRSAIPYFKEKEKISFYKHIGIYAFHKKTLEAFFYLPEAINYKEEKLEQLKALEHNIAIHVILTSSQTIGIDTRKDLEKATFFFEEHLRKK